MKLRSQDNYQSIDILPNYSNAKGDYEGDYRIHLQFRPHRRFTFQFYVTHACKDPDLTGSGKLVYDGFLHSKHLSEGTGMYSDYALRVSKTQYSYGQPNFYSSRFMDMASCIHYAFQWLQWGDDSHLEDLVRINYGYSCYVFNCSGQDETITPRLADDIED